MTTSSLAAELAATVAVLADALDGHPLCHWEAR